MRDRTNMVGYKKDEIKTILLFFMPAVLIWLGILIIPFLYGIFISLTKWDGLGAEFTFVGLDNYIAIFSDPKYLDSLLKTTIYAVAVVVISNVVAVALALLLTSALKGKGFFRTAMYTPNIIGGLILGYLWRFIFNFGLPKIGEIAGIQALKLSWLSSSSYALIAMIIVAGWQLSSYLMIIYIAGISNVPKELLEAAYIDGAGKWKAFRHVTVPMLQSSFTVCIFLSIVRCFMVFDVNISLTGGGPFNSTELIALKVYNTAFTSMKFGEAQAEAVVLFLIVTVISLLQAYLSMKKEVKA